MRASAIVLCAVLWLVSAQHPARVTALVTVRSESAEPLRSLKASDFIVTEGGASREVVEAEVAGEPLSVVLMVDTVQPPMGTQAPIQDLRTSLAAFVTSIRRHEPDAAISLTAFGGAAVPLAPFGAAPAQLDDAIAKLYPDHRPQAVLLEALIDAAGAIRRRPMPRRAIVSVDLHSVEGGNDAAMNRALKEVSEAGATYWAISVRGLDRSAHRRDAVLDALTKSSGGLHTVSADAAGLTTLLTGTAATLSSQYSVTFARPSNQPLGRVQVRCRCRNRVFLSPMMR